MLDHEPVAWEWLAPVGTVVGAAVGALAGVVSGRAAARSQVQAQEVQLRVLKLEVESQHRRELLSVKQGLYGRFLAESHSAYVKVMNVRHLSDRRSEEGKGKLKLAEEALERLGALHGEIAVLADPHLAAETLRLVADLWEGLSETSGFDHFAGMKRFGGITVAMQRDIKVAVGV